jgi:hypothetical protein
MTKIAITVTDKVELCVKGETTHGTLLLTNEGLSFRKPKGKIDPEIVIPWTKLSRILDFYEDFKNYGT